jgi:hypothetical protein
MEKLFLLWNSKEILLSGLGRVLLMKKITIKITEIMMRRRRKRKRKTIKRTKLQLFQNLQSTKLTLKNR